MFDTYGSAPRYIIVLNHGRGVDFLIFKRSAEFHQALDIGAEVIALPRLHDASLRKIDQQNRSFWAAVNSRASGTDGLGLLERQRVKTWLRNAYEALPPGPARLTTRGHVGPGRLLRYTRNDRILLCSKLKHPNAVARMYDDAKQVCNADPFRSA